MNATMQAAVAEIEDRGGAVYAVSGEDWMLYSDDTFTLAIIGTDTGEVAAEESTPDDLADWLGAEGIVDFLIEYGSDLDGNERAKLAEAIASGKAEIASGKAESNE